MNRLKIFISTYACEPGLGSEIGVGWHWVLEMSKYFELWVLTRQTNRHTIEPWIVDHPEYSHIHFLYYDWPKWLRFWKKGMRGVRTYYNIWQWSTNGIVKQTMKKNDIKIFHHLTYGNVLWKVSSYGRKQFFVWGPVGGLETVPKEYSKHYDRRSRLIEQIRRTAVSLLKLNIGFKKRCKQANLILCKTDITRMQIPVTYRSKAILFTDVAVEKNQKLSAIANKEREHTEFITVGRLDAWRGFDLVIEAFAMASKQNKDIHLTIIGQGTDGSRLKKIIEEHRLEHMITMVGKVEMDQYYQYMQECDVVINASLKEGTVTVSFDSMAMGKPLICLDTTGYTRYFSNDYAIVIPIRSRIQTTRDIKAGIEKLTDSDVRLAMGTKAREVGRNFSWEARGKEFFNLLSGKL